MVRLRLADVGAVTGDLLGEAGDGFDALQAIGISRAREMMRGRGQDPRPPSHECVRRWIVEGCPVKGGVLRLKARFLGNQYLTMALWVAEFERERVRLSEIAPLEGERTNRARQAEIRRAEKELDRAKIGTPRGR